MSLANGLSILFILSKNQLLALLVFAMVSFVSFAFMRRHWLADVRGVFYRSCRRRVPQAALRKMPSCLENPMGGGAWWAAVHGVAKSQT